MKFDISRIKAYKACRRQFELKYIDKLEPVEKPEALQVGTNYHKRIENLYKGIESEHDFSKEEAMVEAYKKYIYPKISVQNIIDVEVPFTMPLPNGETFFGRMDGICTDGHVLEHKTTGMEITEEYEYDLQWDEQILAYMYATGCRRMWYTVCRKPNIRLKKNETDEEFFNRMIEWYETDTDSKIRLLEIERTDEEVAEFEKNLFDMVDEINNTKNYYKNTANCFKWGRRCEYAGVCLHYDPEQEYVEYTRRDD